MTTTHSNITENSYLLLKETVYVSYMNPNIQYFKSYMAFLNRTDKSLNGTSKPVTPEIIKDNQSNKGCWNCSDCFNCSHCNYCSYCIDCSYCSYCIDCSYCSYCSDCSHCNYCSYCTNKNTLKEPEETVASLKEQIAQLKIKADKYDKISAIIS